MAGRQRGFTLIELWVSVLIVGTIAAVTVAAFQRGTQTERLRSARDEMLDDLRTMRSYSVSGRPVTYKDTGGTDVECTATGCGGYGMYLEDNKGSYWLFQDYRTPLRQYTKDSAQETLQVKTFPAGILVDNIDYINCGTSYGGGSCFTSIQPPASVSKLHLYFAPYLGSTTFTSPSSAVGQQVKIRLKDTSNNRTIEFTVDKLAGGIRE